MKSPEGEQDWRGLQDWRVLNETLEEIEGPGLLDLETCTQILETAGIKIVLWRLVESGPRELDKVSGDLDKALGELDKASSELSFPLVMKIDSPDITHKSDVGGVITGLTDKGEVRRAYNEMMNRVRLERPDAKVRGVTLHEFAEGVELVLGMSRDPQFGPVVMVGMGGVFVEVLQDLAFRIAPFPRDEALAALDELRSKEILGGYRGGYVVDAELVADAMVALGDLAVKVPAIKEVDLNPMMATGSRVVAADVRIVKGA